MEIKINLASSLIKTSVGKDCPLTVEFDVASFNNEVLSAALVNGFLGALNNIPRSNGPGEKAKSDKEWQKAKMDKVAVWQNGSWGTGRTGERDSLAGEMRAQFVAEMGAGEKAANKKIAETVKEVFGEGESATFTNYLKAVATQIAKARGIEMEPLLEKLEAKYRDMALAAIKARREAKIEIDADKLLAGIDL